MTALLPSQQKCKDNELAALAWAAFERGAYDDALDLLETPKLGTFDPKEVRRLVRAHLSPSKLADPDGHRDLIRLAGLDRGRGRLVTTNFDRLFDTAQASLLSDPADQVRLPIHVAPALPPAKPHAFRGLLYLHGRLEEEPVDDDRNLVLTKSDFGLAYMLDGWARRFVVELFRHYDVVFVGYSLDDPTMHYIVSAMAAVREANPTLFRAAYAFSPYDGSRSLGNKDRAALVWKSKGIEPILYDSANGHEQLWEAFREWAKLHRRGLVAHRQTVVRLGQINLVGKQDPRTDEMEWALSFPGIAEYFAERRGAERPDPVWIEVLQERGFLSRAAYRPDDTESALAPLASRQLADVVALDDTTAHLSRWIARCLEDRDTLHWALTQGSVLHSTLRRNIRWALEDARAVLPKALWKVWRVLASDDYAHALSRTNANDGSSLWLCKGLDATERFARTTLLRWLRPVPVFQMQESEFLGAKKEYDKDPNQWYMLDMVLEGIDHKNEIMEIKQGAADWNGALRTMADELTSLLKEAMDWFSDFGRADSHHDPTHIHYRSISPHKQTEVAPIWTELIGLCRDAHDAFLKAERRDAAKGLVDRWRSLHYPVFRRLALNAATDPNSTIDLGLEVLLEDRHAALWDPGMQRETLRFLRKRGADIPDERLDLVLQETVRGPRREPYFDSLTDDKWIQMRDNEIRLRLQKLQESGANLPEAVVEKYQKIPSDRVARPRRGGSHPEEFGTFISVGWGGIPGFEDPVSMEEIRDWPVAEFAQWAEEHEREPWILRTAWEDLVKQDKMAAARRLGEAGKQRCWPRRLWSKFLHTSMDAENGDKHAVREVGEALATMPSEALAGVSVEAARWLKGNRARLAADSRLRIWQRIWDANPSSDDEGVIEVDLDRTLNHRGGILGEVLFAELADDIPKVGAQQSSGIPRRLRQQFALVGKSESLAAKIARISMAVRLVELYRLDPEWTDGALLSRMGSESGGTVSEIGLWEGYFAGRQCSEDLLGAFKPMLLEVLRDLGRLPARARAGAVHHFIHLAIWQDRGVSQNDAKEVAWAWDQTSLAEAAWAIADVLAAAGNRADVLWEELVGPWFQAVWPRRERDKTPVVSEALCRIALAVDVAFPTVVETIKGFLVPRLRDDTLDVVSKRRVATRFPEPTAVLLDRIIDQDDDEDSKETARELMKEAMEAEPSLREHRGFERLRNILEADATSETESA